MKIVRLRLRRCRARREEGMALIFALGFLALMLILGLGYVTTSLLAQKIAANNSSRAQARMFARSAMARAMVGILLYNDQVIVSGSGKTIESYDFICSFDKVDYNKGSIVGNGTVGNGAVNDQLCKSSTESADESKLKYQTGSEDYTGEKSRAQWMYFYDAPAGTTGRRIIGRAAFQVLPRQAGRLSLYAVTGGPKVDGDYGQDPHTFRWGRDIAELNLDPTTPLANWSGSVNADNIPYRYETLYTSYSSFFTADGDMKKRWVEYWFAEGKNSILKEAFPRIDSSGGTSSSQKVVYFNRFNISDYYYKAADRDNTGNDNWYDRFKKIGSGTVGWDAVTEERKNSSEAIDMLTGAAISYQESDTDDTELDPSGLPFLRRIGSDAWSFKHSTNTDAQALEVLRRQIAANFNDYCDKDAIPTSDVKAVEWSVTDSAKFPVYTGNERTLYINEVALKLGDIKVDFSANSALANGGFSGTNQSNVEISSVTPTLIAELVNMYDPDQGDDAVKALLNPANYEFQTALKKLAFNVALKVTFKFTYQYHLENAEGQTVDTKTSDELEVVVDYDKGAVVKISFAPATPAAKTVDAFGALGNGYSVGTLALDNIESASMTQDGNRQIFADAITGKKDADLPTHNTGGNTAKFDKYLSITVSAVTVRVEGDDAKIEFAPFLLKVKSAATGVAEDVKGKGVDFVRMDRTGEMTIYAADTANPAESTEETPSGSTFTFSDFAVFIGGIEARDPRQNLNPNYSDPQKSDWNLTPRFVKGPDISGTNAIPSLAISANSVTGGAKNRFVDPAAPKYAAANPNDATPSVDIATADVDKETAHDPAWLGDTAGQHVSTAYIRNAPMVSPWEVGLIHRGREWQTLKLTRAGGFGTAADLTIRLEDIKSEYADWTTVGTSYPNGDGAILEYVKTGVGCRCMGKIPLSLLRTAVIRSGGSDYNDVKEEYNKDLIRMLFDGIRRGQTMKQFYTETKFGTGAASAQGGTAVTVTDAQISGFVEEVDRLCGLTGESAFHLRSQFLNSDYGDRGGAFSFGMAGTDNDALREEIIGKTIALLTVNEVTPPNIFRVIVVAQSIKDVGGIGSTDADAITVSRGSQNLNCLIGRFDFIADPNNWENNTYFDEITGEVKALMTVERVPQTNDQGEKNTDYGRMVVTGIEFID